MVEKRPYLLTGGIVPLIENRHKISLNDNVKDALRYVERMYASTAASFLNGRIERDKEGKELYEWEVKFISDQVIEEDLGSLILDSSSSLPIISFDDVYCQDLASGHYHITRVQNPSNLNEEPRLGPRFNSENLKVQTKNILDRYGSEINIMDIGAFSGSTLIPEIERFRDAGINVKNVYLMFAGQNAIINIRNEGVNLKYAMTFNWIDWLELRDCIGFDGRKVLMDADSKDPQNSFIRYIENSKDWASIPEDVKHHYERLYVDSFDIIKSILACDGINADLSKSPDRELVYDLRIARR